MGERGITDQGPTFGHPVAHGKGEFDLSQERFHFSIQGGAADYNLDKVAAEYIQ